MAAAVATTRRPSGPVLSAAHYSSASPTRVKLTAGGNARSAGAASVSVSSSSSSPSSAGGARSRRSCMCSPTNHPGSFRCSLHKERKAPGPGGGGHVHHHHHKPTSPPSPGSSSSSSSAPTSSRLASRRMGSALVRIGAVEGGEWARRALAATARPSPAAQHRRRVGGFRPRPSRLSSVSMAGDRAGDNDQYQ